MKLKEGVLVALICLLVAGCSSQPVPETAVSDCLEKGWVPVYSSNLFNTIFVCNDGSLEVSYGAGKSN